MSFINNAFSFIYEIVRVFREGNLYINNINEQQLKAFDEKEFYINDIDNQQQFDKNMTFSNVNE